MANDSIAARVEELRAMSATAATLTMQQRREIAAAIARDTTARASDRLAAIVADAQLAGELKREATAAASVTVGVAVKVALSEEERRELMAAKQRAIAAREKRMALEEMAARN